MLTEKQADAADHYRDEAKDRALNLRDHDDYPDDDTTDELAYALFRLFDAAAMSPTEVTLHESRSYEASKGAKEIC